ncbi:ATP-binding protein [Vacuolonema iberomarrocanum]|uniref:sensor histidine kinase n=1 Tax=Vacuolonema iberomarrocanum TaxID=3454632 RepID=UPI003F6DE7DF
MQLSRQLILNLLARAEHPCQLVGEAYDETEMAPLHQAANNRTTLAFLYVGKLSLSYLFQNIDSALASAAQAEEYLDGAVAMPCVVLFHFYAALAKLAQYPHVNANAQHEILEQVVHHQSRLRHWADHAPMNYQHKFYLVEAERSRVLDQKADAIAYYDLAIAGAKAHRFIAEEALANERAARFYSDWGKVKIAQDYLSHAYYGYAHWGAIAKVQDLEHSHLDLLTPILQPQSLSLSTTETVFPAAALATHQTSGHPSHDSTSSSISTAIDLETVLKASQTLSSKIQLDTLLATLLQTVLENAGADKGVLLMPHQNDWYVEAVAAVAQPARVESILLADSADVPQSLINTVKRSLEPVLIANIAAHVTLATDTYIMQQQPKSLLCTPILQRGRLVAILYLENRVAIEAFTPDRVELLNALCAQAAISLENARLYSQSQEHQRWLTTLLSNLPGMVYSSTNDQTRTLQFVSEGGVRLTGYQPDELTGQHATSYTALIHADDREMVDATVQTALQTHQPFQMTYRIRTKQGQEKWVWEQGQGLYDQAGTFLSLEGFVTDISERKVAEAAVIQKSQELEQALAQLQNTQLQMVQNEKMASLGNLVAGVAHEINNPIGFLNGSIKNAQDYAQDLFAHLAVYQQHQAPIKAVQEHAEDIDLDFLLEDLPKLFESMQGAIGRIRGISTSLRTFSRADTKHKVSANLNEGLESTLLILKYRLKANEQRPAIQVIKDYGNLPEIDCFPGQLNQVFMNILANAIDVFDEATQDATFEDLKANPQVITIQTEVVKDAIEIRIRDNGKGMSEAVRAKIFDHLFTTKAVGKGTGLGMAIARQVVMEKHGGSLDVQSELGQGTEFYIRLPLAAADETDSSPGQNPENP